MDTVVCRPCPPAVGAFHYDFRLDLRCVFFRDLTFECGRNQDIAFNGPELVLRYRVRAFETSHATVLGNVIEQGDCIDTRRLVQRTGVILDRHHFRAGFLEQPCSDAADVTKTLHRDPRPLNIEPNSAPRFRADDKHATAGRFLAAERTAERDRLAGPDTTGPPAPVPGGQ